MLYSLNSGCPPTKDYFCFGAQLSIYHHMYSVFWVFRRIQLLIKTVAMYKYEFPFLLLNRIDVDECASNPCQNGATCSHGYGNDWYSCECDDGWEDTNCDISEYPSMCDVRCTPWSMHACLLWYALLLVDGINLCMGSSNVRRHYYVTPCLIGQAHTKNDPWVFYQIFSGLLWMIYP